MNCNMAIAPTAIFSTAGFGLEFRIVSLLRQTITVLVKLE